MKITNNDMIANIRSLLRDVIAPELQSDLARARLRSVLATLRDVDWDEAPLALMRENEALQGLLAAGQPAANGPAVTAATPTARQVQALNERLRAELAAQFASPAGQGWDAQHIQAARVLEACARDRARPAGK